MGISVAPSASRIPHVDDRVRLLDGVPGTALSRGQVGVVCSEWAGCSKPTYEVEFVSPGHDDVSRRLLTIEQITIDDGSPSNA